MSATPSSVAELVVSHRVIGLDSDVLIYVIDAHPVLGSTARALVDAVEDGKVRAVMATVGVTEILSGPARAGDGVRFELMEDELASIANLDVVPLDRELAADAAWYRGAGDRDLPDAVHLVTARRRGATAFVTNDRRIRARPGIDVILLADLASG